MPASLDFENAAVLKHAEFLQNIITRMANNSADCKRWGLVIVAAIFAFSASNKEPYQVCFALLPTTMFWFLDTYYLLLERAYRDVFNEAMGKLRENAYTRDDLMQLKAADPNYKSVVKVAFSPKTKSIFPFYFVLNLVVLLACGFMG